ERVEAETAEQHDGKVHGDGHHLAMGEIDDAHDPENDREADRHQAVDKAGQKTADRDVEIDLCGHRSVLPQGRSRPSHSPRRRALRSPYGNAPPAAAAGAGSACEHLSRAGHTGSSAVRAWRSTPFLARS